MCVLGLPLVQGAECSLGREGNLLDNSPLSEPGGSYDQLGSAWRKGLISETIPQVVYKWFTCVEKRRDLSFFLYAATIHKQNGNERELVKLPLQYQQLIHKERMK